MFAEYFDVWRLGVKSLLLHPLRSFLTILGILVGVASVVWLLAIGEGISVKAQEQIASLGADNIIIRTIKPPAAETADSRGPMPHGITKNDYDMIRETVPTVTTAIRIREIPRSFNVGSRTLEGRLVGCDPGYAEFTHLELESGRFLTETDLTEEENVCVLAAETAQRLFPGEDPLDKTVHIDEQNYDQFFVVVGVMKPRGATAGIGGSLAAQDFSRDVYIPITTLWRRIGEFVMYISSGSREGEIVELTQLTVRVDELGHVEETADFIEDTLAVNHHMNDYRVVVPLELLEQAKTTKMLFMVFMGLMAAISLVVGGIGIMNIMLATVTERTREIGVRRALGARKGDITRQFLAETVVLSVAGGMAGIAAGLTCRPVTRGARWAAERIFPEAMANLPEVMQEVQPVIVTWSIPLAFCISVFVGVLFGLYPARRAAAMDPVEALRHE